MHGRGGHRGGGSGRMRQPEFDPMDPNPETAPVYDPRARGGRGGMVERNPNAPLPLATPSPYAPPTPADVPGATPEEGEISSATATLPPGVGEIPSAGPMPPGGPVGPYAPPPSTSMVGPYAGGMGVHGGVGPSAGPLPGPLARPPPPSITKSSLPAPSITPAVTYYFNSLNNYHS
jgi:hypothetical protein